MGKKIYIQLRDKSGSYHNVQQGLTISRADVLRVEYNLSVQAGIANKLFVEIPEAKALELGIKNLTDEEKQAAENEVTENLRLIMEKAEKEAKELEAAEKAAKEKADQEAAEKLEAEELEAEKVKEQKDEKAPAKGKGK